MIPQQQVQTQALIRPVNLVKQVIVRPQHIPSPPLTQVTRTGSTRQHTPTPPLLQPQHAPSPPLLANNHTTLAYTAPVQQPIPIRPNLPEISTSNSNQPIISGNLQTINQPTQIWTSNTSPVTTLTPQPSPLATTPQNEPVSVEFDFSSNKFGFLQLNEFILPYIKLTDHFYHYNRKFPKCNIYVCVQHLTKTSLISEKEVERHLSIVPLEQSDLSILNNLISYHRQKHKTISKLDLKTFDSKVDLVNINEFQFVYAKAAFFKRLKYLKSHKRI